MGGQKQQSQKQRWKRRLRWRASSLCGLGSHWRVRRQSELYAISLPCQLRHVSHPKDPVDVNVDVNDRRGSNVPTTTTNSGGSDHRIWRTATGRGWSSVRNSETFGTKHCLHVIVVVVNKNNNINKNQNSERRISRVSEPSRIMCLLGRHWWMWRQCCLDGD